MKALRAVFMAALAVATNSGWAGEPNNPDFSFPAPGTYALPTLWVAADGTVLTSEGRTTTLHRAFSGKMVLLSFIYTQCRDARGCPLATSVLAQLRRRLDEAPIVSQRVRIISLSFDPTHDTPAMMREYGARFAREGADWLFLTTTSEATLQPILNAYRQTRQRAYESNRELSSYSHVLRVFLIDQHRAIRNIYNADFLDPRLLVNDIITLIRETGPLGAAQKEMSTPLGIGATSALIRR